MDGKVLEFKTLVLVKDLLMNDSGSGIGLSREASNHLPLNYQLKIGEDYYILPSTEAPSHAAATAGGVKRIKVVITKQQLEQLSKQTFVGEVPPTLKRRVTWSIDSHSPTNWKPKLESIPEGTE